MARILFSLIIIQFFAPQAWSQQDGASRVARTASIREELLDRRYTSDDHRKYVEQLNSGEISGQGGPVNSTGVTNVLVNNNDGATSTSNFTQSETSILAFGNYVVIGFNDAGSYTGTNNQFTGWAYSTNGGISFVDGGRLPVSTIGDVGDPVLARNETTGRIYFSTLGFSSPGTIQMWRSDDNGLSWMAPVNATPGGSNEDKQWHVVDNFPGSGNGNVYVISRRFGTPQGIYVFRSTDHGNTFGPSGGVNIVSGNQGAFIAVGPDHSVYAFWWASGTTVDSIKMRKSTDFGVTFGPRITVVSGLVGGSNGDLGLTGIRQGTTTPASFRSNSFPHVAVNPVSGNIYVTYNNDGPGADKADVFFVQSTDGGTTWSSPFKVNDDATTTDQWQPTIAVTPNGSHLGIFYYSRQEDPTGNNLFKYYGRIGTISGSTIAWQPSFPVSDVASLPEFGRDPVINSTYMGDYNHAAATLDAFHVSWSDNRDDLPGGAPRKDPNVYYKKIPLVPTITVLVPNGGETWPISSTQTIQWTSSGITGNVKIELSRNGGATFSEVLFASTTNDGSENWTVMGPATSQARIRISSVSDPSVADTSNANFSIVQPTITVLVPNGGETWPIGSTQTIQWSSSFVTGNVKIELSRNGGATFSEVLFASTANDGSENWTVTGPATSQARIRISSVSDPSVADTSNGNFSIVQPTITVLVPNGGETWPIGSTQTIQWSSSFVTGNVKIELSRNGGATFSEVLFASTTNDGSENWTVTGPATSQARIRISSVSDPSVADTSNGNFSIVQPTITVLVPNGGETWPIGSTQTIQWSSSFVTGNVKIELSRNGGATFSEVLFASTTNDGSENWTVTGPATSQARIRILSVSDPSVADTSNGNFSIVQPTITVLVPNGGETWLIGSTQTIQWTSSGITGDVRIELSRNGGTSYETLFASTANDGLESWVVTAPMTANALVTVSSVDMPAVVDQSNAPFTIRVEYAVFMGVILRDNGNEVDTLEFGTAPGATDGIDEVFGEYELPPVPPVGAFDVRWQIVGVEGARRDIRDTLGGTRQQVTYTGRVQPGEGGYPFYLRWSAAQLPATGSFTLKYLSDDTLRYVNMRQQDSAVIGDASTFQIIYTLGTTVHSLVQQGWNVVSVPVTVDDVRRSAVFPTSTSSAFVYTPAGYVIRDTLDYGVGYWLRFGTGQTVEVTGEERQVDTVDVVAGWNMIGSISASVAVGTVVQIPSGIVVSSYFGYGATGYSPSTTIEPMKGYWVRVNQSGQLVLIGGTVTRPAGWQGGR